MSRHDMHDSERTEPWEEREVDSAGSAAGRIGGRAGDEDLDPAQRPLSEAGEGEAEGFELAEEDLVNAAEHGDGDADPLRDAYPSEESPGAPSGEADEEPSSESSKGRW